MPGSDFPESVRKQMRSRSTDSWECYGETRDRFQININREKTVSSGQGIYSGFAVRIVKGRRTGTAYMSGQDVAAINECACLAEKNSLAGTETDDLPVFSAGFDVPDVREYYDTGVDGPDRHTRILQSDEIWNQHRIKGFNLAEGIFREERVNRFIITSNGADLRSTETLFHTSGKWFAAHSGKIMYEDHASSHFEHSVQPSWPDTLQVLAQSVSGYSLTQGYHKKMDLILSPEAGRYWLSVLFGSYFNGYRIKELLLGPSPSNDGFIVSDDRTIRTAPGSATFDGEGYPTRKINLFRNGTADQEIVDSEAAGKNPTGYTERDEWLRPFPAPGNLYIRNGTQNCESMIQRVNRGIWVFKLFGLIGEEHSQAIVFGFEGLGIQDGHITGFCAGMTGPITRFRWIQNLSGIGNDLRINQRVSSPTLKFSDMHVRIY